MNKLLTTEEAAAYTGLSRQRICQLVYEKKLIPVRSRPYLFTVAALAAALRPKSESVKI